VAAGEISLAKFGKDFADGTVGGRVLYYALPIVADRGRKVFRSYTGADLQMRNLFRRADPVTGTVWYDNLGDGDGVVRIKPVGMVTQMVKQGGPDPLAVAKSATKAAISIGTAKTMKKFY
jgi:hypothetical protein